MLLDPGYKPGLKDTFKPVKGWYKGLGIEGPEVKLYEVPNTLLRRCGMSHLHAFAPACIHFGYIDQDALKAFYTTTLVPILGKKHPTVPKEHLPQIVWDALDYCLTGSGAPQPFIDFVNLHKGPRIYLSERITSMSDTSRNVFLEATLAHEYLHILQDSQEQTERCPFALEVFPRIASTLYGLSTNLDFEDIEEETLTFLDTQVFDEVQEQGSNASKVYSLIGQTAERVSEDNFPKLHNGTDLETKLSLFSQIALSNEVNQYLDFSIALQLVEIYLAETGFIPKPDPFALQKRQS
jgi:hypothetical protein